MTSAAYLFPAGVLVGSDGYPVSAPLHRLGLSRERPPGNAGVRLGGRPTALPPRPSERDSPASSTSLRVDLEPAREEIRELRAERDQFQRNARHITDPAIRSLPVIGAADQFIDSADVLGHCEMTRTVTRALINRNQALALQRPTP
ncbi:hypothetical protein [Streptomyces chiangmaiensis]|uniref:Uncharacterized protein n=1 Tax=Streptomyces chiangmaiensis TaxID=766497 RepID=A0ABU7FDY6_9ACTN|nr:hypothetical protein [Streptomyces chiangmaiensis]MED7822023.1 hypothetical protein [Streptomyces chiangmaiensis]